MSINLNEAPKGFYAVLKSTVNRETTPNVCTVCDARSLCVENKDDWCLKNRCMGYEIKAFLDGNTYSREDKCSVFFRKKSTQPDLFEVAV